MKLGQAAFAGATGAAVASLVLGVGRAFGLPLAVEQLVGTMISGSSGVAGWALGIGALMVAGSLVAVGYAFVFQRAACGVDIRLGMALGCVQATLAAMAVVLAGVLEPGAADLLDAPGLFVSTGVPVIAGAIAVALFAAANLAFAAVVTAVYGSASPGAGPHRSRLDLPVVTHRSPVARDARPADRPLDRAA